MLESHRQEKLNPILTDLRAVPGVVSVQQDDFDSAYINVFIEVRFNGIRPAVPLRNIRAGIGKVMKAHKQSFNWLNWPKAQYQTSPRMPGIPAEKYLTGYDTTAYKVEVCIPK